MLRLKRLELQGFKSFADRTELRFDGAGIVAIVGPNGCGKSNLAEAISWVLGEQSAKTLRSSRMEDVIFAGTRERKPVSLAQVSMTLVEAAPAAEGAPDGRVNGKATRQGREITITRRLFRSGESEYLIDGRPARLRDIQEIFMGTGLGPDAYAIIEQGRIGQILSSKPQDRRLLIEEAAGISRFKTRRRLAEAKLEAAKHNLERVFDILEEVGRQVNSLKRQAAKARRWEDLRAQMQAQLRLVLGARHRILEREAAQMAVELSLAAGRVDSLSREVASKDKAHAAAEAELLQVEARLAGTRQRVADLNVAQERARGRLELQARQAASLEERLSRGRAEVSKVEAALERLLEELAVQSESLAALERQAEKARERLDEKTRERQQLEEALRERERTIEAARQAVLRLLGEEAALRNQLVQVEEYLLAIQRDAARADKEQKAAVADLEWTEQALKELVEKVAARKHELAELVAEKARVEGTLAAARRELTDARQQLEQLREEHSQLKARRDSLEEIVSHRAYTTEAVKRLFTAVQHGHAEGLAPLGVLADFLEVEPGWEKAVEEFLHDELEYVVVDSWPEAERGLELVRASGEGRVTFLVRNAAGTGKLDPVELGDGRARPLAGVLRLNGAGSAGLLAWLPRVNRCWLVADREAALGLAQMHPGLYFLLPDGTCFQGNAVSGGKKRASGPLALKRELRELRAAVRTREERLEEITARIAGLEQQMAGLAGELERLRASEQAVEKQVVALEHEQRKLAEEKQRALSRLALAGAEKERLEKEKAQAHEQSQQWRVQLEEKEGLRAEKERALAIAQQELERLKMQAARCAEEHSGLRVELAGIEERRRGQAATYKRVENQVRELEARRRELQAELKLADEERDRLCQERGAVEKEIEALAGRLAEATKEAEQLAAEQERRRQALSILGEELRGLRDSLQVAQQERSRIEIELVRRQAELHYLDETSRKELGIAVNALCGEDEPVPEAETLVAAEQKYEELKQRLEALGPVNPQAVEEYRQTQQRYDFLNAQRQDLLDSIRDTERVICEIDTETRKRFQEAFQAINAHFQQTFRELFGGGTAEMRLTDAENLAESGIEVVASPPGKRLQNVLLLSGGEKALTALALLLAIFKYQPSPFCVLDEVDAPLDDPNIDRLMRLLREMSQQTQFILITHTKRTMEAAQALYGVTMEEPGVSKLVSVRFQNPAVPSPPTHTIEMAARA